MRSVSRFVTLNEKINCDPLYIVSEKKSLLCLEKTLKYLFTEDLELVNHLCFFPDKQTNFVPPVERTVNFDA